MAFALTFFAYSTWKGTCLYLEDIYVEPEHRGSGIGLALIARCVAFAQAHRCQRVMWQALDWNSAAIAFYTEKLGAVVMKEWISLRLTHEGIGAFTQKYSSLIDTHGGGGAEGGAAAGGRRIADGDEDGRPSRPRGLDDALPIASLSGRDHNGGTVT